MLPAAALAPLPPPDPLTGPAPVPVTILMALCDGAPFVEDQIASLADLAGVTALLHVRDDASEDGSLGRVARACRTHGLPHRTARNATRQGFAATFLTLLRDLPGAPGLVALCDQDDVWHRTKLRRAARILSRVPPGQAAMVCGRVRVCDARLTLDGQVLPVAAPRVSFANALVENVCRGNTIVLNAAAARLARDCAAAALGAGVYAHDWWLYLLLTGTGGQVLFDPVPGLLYRQHGRNAIGAPPPRKVTLRRVRGLLDGSFAGRVTRNLAALQAISPRLTPEARAAVAHLHLARDAGPVARLRSLGTLRLHRQSRTGTAGLWGAALLGRL